MKHIFLKLENIFSNKLVQFASMLGLFLGYLADAISDEKVYLAFAIFILLILLIAIIDEMRKYDIFHTDTIHIPVVIRVDDNTDTNYVLETLLKKIEKEHNLHNYKENLLKYRRVNLDEFIFQYNGDLFDFKRLLSFAQIINYKINQTEKALKTRVLFHVAYYKRPSIAFMLGVIFRTEGVILYQNDDGGRTFQNIANVTSREYKEHVEKLEKYTLTDEINDNEDDTLLFIINSASHNVDPRVKSLRNYTNRATMTLKPQKVSRAQGEKIVKGTIPPEDNWAQYSQEIYTKIHDYRLQYKKIVIAHAMPEALAFLVGMAMENYWNIEITQYYNNDNVYLYNMQDIKFYF